MLVALFLGLAAAAMLWTAVAGKAAPVRAETPVQVLRHFTATALAAVTCPSPTTSRRLTSGEA